MLKIGDKMRGRKFGRFGVRLNCLFFGLGWWEMFVGCMVVCSCDDDVMEKGIGGLDDYWSCLVGSMFVDNNVYFLRLEFLGLCL